MAGVIRTVTGDQPCPDGMFLIHEHLQIDLSHNKGPETVLGPQDRDDIISDLFHCRATHALNVVAEMSVPGSGRDVVSLKAMSEASGVAVVAATGFYWDPIHPDVLNGSVEDLRRALVREIQVGVDNTGIKCGVIKVGTDKGEPPEASKRLFIAAAQASLETGAAIITHTSTPDQAQWQIDVLEDAGAVLSRVLISHLHGLKEFIDLLGYAKRGVKVGFDQVGFAKGPTYEDYADLIAKTVAAGLVSRVLIASDVARRVRLMKYDGTSYGTVFTELLPLLRARGVSEQDIHTMMHDNPAGLLSLAH